MKTKQALVAGLGIMGVLLLYTLAVYNHLPEMLPVHWNLRGEPDGWASRETAVLIMPAIVAALLVMMLGLPAISPRQFSIERFRSAYNYIMVVVVALMGYIHLIMLQAGLHPQMNMNKALTGGIFLFLALMGNMLGKIRRNFWMGVKTPWTLASDQVWDATHRLAGRLMVAAGLLGCIMAIAGASPVVCFVLLFAAAMYPAVYSYFLYKKIEGK